MQILPMATSQASCLVDITQSNTNIVLVQNLSSLSAICLLVMTDGYEYLVTGRGLSRTGFKLRIMIQDHSLEEKSDWGARTSLSLMDITQALVKYTLFQLNLIVFV